MKSFVCLLILSVSFLADSLSADDRRPFALAGDRPEITAVTEPIEGEPEASTLRTDPSGRRTQWLMFTAEWCVPCRTARNDFEPWLKRSGWVVSESQAAHIRLVDGERQANLVQQQGIRLFPTFVLMQDGRELRRHEGYPGRTELVRQFQDAVRTEPPAVGTISVGTLKGQRDNIAGLISVFRPLLGTAGTLTVRLDRPGTPTAVLSLGDRLSIHADSPLVMNYTLKADVLTCRFAEPYPRGRFTFGLPVEQSVSSVSLSVSEVVLELPHAPDVRLKVEP